MGFIRLLMNILKETTKVNNKMLTNCSEFTVKVLEQSQGFLTALIAKKQTQSQYECD